VLLQHDVFPLEDTVAEAKAQAGRGWAVPLTRSCAELGLAAALGD
jgi:hypothetical protein